ncbi:hypothetical protein HPDP_00555 [Candidatus Hepatincola sp. Pdp]
MKLNLSQLLQLDLQLLKKIKSSFYLPVLTQKVFTNLNLNPNKPQCFLDYTFNLKDILRTFWDLPNEIKPPIIKEYQPVFACVNLKRASQCGIKLLSIPVFVRLYFWFRGYTKYILEIFHKNTKVIGIDPDEIVVARLRGHLKHIVEFSPKNTQVIAINPNETLLSSFKGILSIYWNFLMLRFSI